MLLLLEPNQLPSPTCSGAFNPAQAQWLPRRAQRARRCWTPSCVYYREGKTVNQQEQKGIRRKPGSRFPESSPRGVSQGTLASPSDSHDSTDEMSRGNLIIESQRPGLLLYGLARAKIPDSQKEGRCSAAATWFAHSLGALVT